MIDVCATESSIADKSGSTMEHAVIVKDQSCPWFELHPVLAFWIGKDLVPFAEGVVERLYVVSVNTEDGAVVIVIANKHEFTCGVIVLEDGVAAIEERADHGVLIASRVGSNPNAAECFVCVWVDVFQDSCGEEAVNQERLAACRAT